MEELLEIINKVNDDIHLETDNIMTDGILDSVELVELITLIEEHYKIEVSLDDMDPDNFDSCEKIYNLILVLKERYEI